jgi:hypothetical protein
VTTYRVGLIYEVQADDDDHAIEQFLDLVLNYEDTDNLDLSGVDTRDLIWPNMLVELDEGNQE